MFPMLPSTRLPVLATLLLTTACSSTATAPETSPVDGESPQAPTDSGPGQDPPQAADLPDGAAASTEDQGPDETTSDAGQDPQAIRTEYVFFQESNSLAGQRIHRNGVFLVEVAEGNAPDAPIMRVEHQWSNDLEGEEGATGYLMDSGLALVSGGSYPGFPGSGVTPATASPVRHVTGAHGVLRLLEPDGTVAWQYVRCDYEPNGSGGLTAGQSCLHHDLAPMPNGHVLATMQRRLPRAELEQKGWANANEDAQYVWVETILELEPIFGEDAQSRCQGLGLSWSAAAPWCTAEVWSLDLADYLGAAGDDPEVININLVGDVSGRQGGLKDVLLHVNSLSYSAERDEIIVSSMAYDEFYVFERASGKLVYRWGNPNNYGCNAGVGATLCGQVTKGQHDVTWSGPDSIVIHNNNRGPGSRGSDDPDCLASPDNCSKVIEIQLPLDANGGYRLDANAPFGPHPYDDRETGYRVLYGPYSTVFASGADRFANGDILLTKTNSRELRRARVTEPPGTDDGVGPNTQGDWVWNVQVPYLEQPDPTAPLGYTPAECGDGNFGTSCAQIFKARVVPDNSAAFAALQARR